MQHRVHKIDGEWVVGMVERTIDRNTILIPFKKRGRNTLDTIIRLFVKEKSIIYTDCWKFYNDLSSIGSIIVL